VAPEAVQVASLKEYTGANPGSVMDGETLDIEYTTLHNNTGTTQLKNIIAYPT